MLDRNLVRLNNSGQIDLLIPGDELLAVLLKGSELGLGQGEIELLGAA